MEIIMTTSVSANFTSASFTAYTTGNNSTGGSTNCCECDEAPAPTTTQNADGSITYESEAYLINVTDTGDVNITNKATGENYLIWGDPHVAINGQQAFDFWGTTTFMLDDGTKITIETTPVEGMDGATMASTVTITNPEEDYGVQITGVDSNETGDLTYTETSNPELMDAMVDDGNTIYENPVGAGFVAVDDCGNVQTVDQAYINETDELKNPEQEAEEPSCDKPPVEGDVKDIVDKFAKLVNIFTGIVAIHFLGNLLGGNDGRNDRGPNVGRPGGNNVSLDVSHTSVDMNLGGGNNGMSMSLNHTSVDLTISRGSSFC
jgi:hypothetical protein